MWKPPNLDPKDRFHRGCLSFMQGIHPPNCLGITDLSQIHLGGFQVLMPEDYFRDNFQRNPVSAGICRRMPSEIVGRDFNAEFLSVLLNQGSCCKIADGEEPIPRSERFSVEP